MNFLKLTIRTYVAAAKAERNVPTSAICGLILGQGVFLVGSDDEKIHDR